MKSEDVIERIKTIESPLKRQLLMVGLITKLFEEEGKDPPIIIGGCALAYYSREVYFTSDIDLSCKDRETLNKILLNIGFQKRGRYWINEKLKMAIEAPISVLTEEDSPIEIVDLGEGFYCKIIGLEDLLIDRMNACKHWRSETDCEMVELLIKRYIDEIDWSYIEKKAKAPQNDTLLEFLDLKRKALE